MAYQLVQRDRCVFHITHIKNVPTIVRHGLLCKNLVVQRGIGYTDVAHDNIQDVRSRICVPSGSERTLHDYVPAFFGARPPMLYAVRRKGISQEDMVYILIKWSVLDYPDTYFSDGNARTNGTQFFTGTSNLSQIDFAAVEARYWADKGAEFKRRKQAEVLKPDSVSTEDILGFMVHNAGVEQKVQTILTAQDISRRIYVAPEFYY